MRTAPGTDTLGLGVLPRKNFVVLVGSAYEVAGKKANQSREEADRLRIEVEQARAAATNAQADQATEVEQEEPWLRLERVQVELERVQEAARAHQERADELAEPASRSVPACVIVFNLDSSAQPACEEESSIVLNDDPDSEAEEESGTPNLNSIVIRGVENHEDWASMSEEFLQGDREVMKVENVTELFSPP